MSNIGGSAEGRLANWFPADEVVKNVYTLEFFQFVH